MRIDVHAHYYPPEMVARMEEFGRSLANAVRITCECPIQERLEMLDENRVDLQVLSTGVQQPYLPDAQKARGAARYINDLYQDVATRFSGRYSVFGCLPLPHVDAAIAEVAYCLDELKMPGINLGCSIAGRPLEEPAFEPVWAELDRRATVVFLHPIALGGPMLDAPGLPMLLGSRFEDTAAAVRLVVSGLTERFPNVKIIVPHLGGAIPFMWERMDDFVNRGLTGSPKEGLRKLYYDTVNKGAAALRCACEVLDPSHIMLGTDFPYMRSKAQFADYVGYVGRSDLPPETAEAILDRNAHRLLGL